MIKAFENSASFKPNTAPAIEVFLRGSPANDPTIFKDECDVKGDAPPVEPMPIGDPIPAVEPMPDLSITTPPLTGVDIEIQQDINQLSVAWMTVIGMTPDQIEESLGAEPGHVATIRSMPEFRILLKRCLEMKAQSVIENADNPEELFNSQIADSVSALMQIRDNPFATDTARLNASVQFLDRAPKAPKVRREVEQHQTIITLPVSALRGMQQALLEEGSPQDIETIELLEGSGYNIEGNGGSDGQIAFERVE